jgi:hypothetical protein
MSTNTSVAIKKFHPVREIRKKSDIQIRNELFWMGSNMREYTPRGELLKVITSLPKPDIEYLYARLCK